MKSGIEVDKSAQGRCAPFRPRRPRPPVRKPTAAVLSREQRDATCERGRRVKGSAVLCLHKVLKEDLTRKQSCLFSTKNYMHFGVKSLWVTLL